jgi:phage tail-like protein
MTNGFYPVSFSFQLSFRGNEEDEQIGFQEASGLNSELVATEDLGDENRLEPRLPIKARNPNLVLKRGLVGSSSTLLTWGKQILNGDYNAPIATKDITVALLDSEGKVLFSRDFIDAFPVKWCIDDFNATNNAIIIESIEFAYNHTQG